LTKLARDCLRGTLLPQRIIHIGEASYYLRAADEAPSSAAVSDEVDLLSFCLRSFPLVLVLSGSQSAMQEKSGHEGFEEESSVRLPSVPSTGKLALDCEAPPAPKKPGPGGGAGSSGGTVILIVELQDRIRHLERENTELHGKLESQSAAPGAGGAHASAEPKLAVDHLVRENGRLSALLAKQQAAAVSGLPHAEHQCTDPRCLLSRRRSCRHR
jgi:hypothetical protein